MEKTAIYAGSFDPFTLGHLEVIHEAAHDFDKIIIAVGENAEKQSLFNHIGRVGLITKTIKENNNDLNNTTIKVISYKGLTIDLCMMQNVNTLIRGIRDATDEVEEEKFAIINQEIANVRGFSIKTVEYKTCSKFTNVSSSAVKKLFDIGEYIVAFNYVSPAVHNAMAQHYLLQKEHTRACDFAGKELYDIGNRAYHNFSHTAYCINYINIAKKMGVIENWKDYNNLIAAAFYHDLFISDGGEEKSAEFIHQNRNAFNPQIDAYAVYNLIMATEHSTERDLEGMSAIMHDVDLMCLADAKNSDTFTQLIFKEYEQQGVSWEQFKEGRKAFLTKMLSRKSIFKHQFFYSRFEDKARGNIGYMIKNL